MDGVYGIMNIPAVIILAILSALLIRGTRESAFVNSIIVVTKVSIVLMVIVIGWRFINPANHTPFIPEATTYVTPQGVTHTYGGVLGILGAAGVVFFAFIGFDAVSTAAQETKNPKTGHAVRHPRLAGRLHDPLRAVLVRAERRRDGRGLPDAGREASVAFAISKYMTGYEWLSQLVTVAILAGFSSVILVMLLGQSRVFYAMSQDGLVPKVFSEVHPRYKTPWKSNMIFFVLTALFGAFIPGDVVGEMTSIGTLFAFMLVCAGVWIMRVRRPDIPRGFVVPALPVVAVLGIITCGAMIYGLGWTNWMRLAAWLVIGLVLFFGYARAQPSGAESVGNCMTARVLDGQALAARMQEEIKPEVAAFTKKHGRPPGLGIVLAGNDPASEVYVGHKVKAGTSAGFRVDLERLPETASLADALALVERLNASPDHDGILVQSPLPKGMGRGAEQAVFDTIDPAKDVDGFGAASVGLLVQNRPKLVACTPSGVIELLRAREHSDCRPPRRRHRPQRHRRQADGDAAAASRRDGDDLPLEDAESRRGLPPGGHPRRGRRATRARDARLREAGRRGHRRRHQPRDRRGGGVAALSGRASPARALSVEGLGPRRRRAPRGRGSGRRADAGARRRRSADDHDADGEHAEGGATSRAR